MSAPTISGVLSERRCASLKGIGPRFAERLQHMGIETIADLLFHLPLRYQDRTRIVPVSDLLAGNNVAVAGKVVRQAVLPGRRSSLVCQLEDGSGGRLQLRFFHFTKGQKESLAPGTSLRCFGEVRVQRGQLEMVHPEYQRVEQEGAMPVETHLTAVYPTAEGLGQRQWRTWIAQAFAEIEAGWLMEEFLPVACFDAEQPDLLNALRTVHYPPPDAVIKALNEKTHPSQKRLIFEELVAHQVSVRQFRHQQQQRRAPCLPPAPLQQRFLAQLPFTLTRAQQEALDDISADLHSSTPMMRLLQGDVGCGKTVVAAVALLQAAANGYQAALMVPTEILAEQHVETVSAWFTALEVPLLCLTGKLSAAQKTKAQQAIAEGTVSVVIGTHALVQKAVTFKKLGLIIVDEQHRFGVHQRLALQEKGQRTNATGEEGPVPHQLTMTATPIPRTLAMTAYADLDCSVIATLPPGRTPVKTVAIAETRRDEVIARIAHTCSEHQRQVYWVCTLIDESETLSAQAAATTADALAEALPQLRIGLVHGRLSVAEKAAVMTDFAAGAIDVLVATTVIEVGVNVPNASLMIIENPERLGLAQLHQLRGRVGRGEIESHCVLLYSTPLGATAKQRLNVLRDSTDGFVIAEKDLALRGPGEVLGTRQTGVVSFKIADLERDQGMLEKAQRAADRLLRDHPEQAALLVTRWLADKTRYGQA